MGKPRPSVRPACWPVSSPPAPIMHIAKRKGRQVRYRPAADHKADRGGYRDDYTQTGRVATARCMSRPAAPKSGTDNVPPPIPMSADKKPVMPASSFCKRDESVGTGAALRFAPRNMRAPRTSASVAKINFNPSGTIRRAKSAPNKAPSPTNAPTFQDFNIDSPALQMTARRLPTCKTDNGKRCADGHVNVQMRGKSNQTNV